MMDTSALDSRIFDGLSDTSDKRYIVVTDIKKDVSRWSKGAVEYFGLPGEYIEHSGEVWLDYVHPEDREEFVRNVEMIMHGESFVHRMDYRARNRSGDYVLLSCRGKVVRGREGEPDLFVGSIENHGIADKVDPATNLYNVYEFLQHIRGLRLRGVDAVELLIGITSFSEINDMYGYAFGDEVLFEVGHKLCEILGSSAKVFRMDGVRFGVCFTDRQIASVYEIYRRIQYELKYNVFVKGIRIPISVSAGAVVLTGDYDEYSVQGSARFALEQSKHEKHGELYVFDNNMKGSKRKKLALISAMRRSMLNGYEGFYLCYQPLISSDTEELIGAEALIRWKNEDFGQVMPGEFIPVLENDPSFFELGNWILKTALTESRRLVESHEGFTLNVNISYAQLSHPLFRGSVKSILESTGFPAQRLCMELTESCRQLEKSYLQAEIAYLTGLGIRIAIDDFGTGFSSLNLLSELPVETLKFDRGFTMDLMTNKANQSIIKAISSCAEELHVHVCLEGMETREMIDFSKQYCIYSFQGYYYSRPIIIGKFEELYGVFVREQGV